MRQENTIYSLFGRFVVEFEMITNTLETSVRTILYNEGLSNHSIVDCMLAGMTSEPLSALAQSLCYEHLKPSKEESNVIDYIFAQHKKLISKRNDLVHGQHFVVLFDDEPSKSNKAASTLSYKLHKNKKGSATKITQHNEQTLTEVYEETMLSLKNVIKLRNCLDSSYSIMDNFEETRKGVYLAKSGLMIARA